MAPPVTQYRITDHAAFEMARRDIGDTMVQHVLLNPEQRYAVRPGRDLLQSRIALGGKLYLLRVLVDVDHEPPVVVTVYRTSKIAKYWRTER